MNRSIFFSFVVLLLLLSACVPSVRTAQEAEVQGGRLEAVRSSDDFGDDEDVLQDLAKIPDVERLVDSATIFFDAQQYDRALAAYLKAYHLLPRFFCDEHFFAVGTLYFLREDYVEAKAFFEKSLTAENKSEGWERWAMEYSLLQLYRGAGEKVKAYKLCWDIQARGVTGLAGTYLNSQIAEVYMHYKDYHEAVKAFDKAVECYKNSPEDELSKPIFHEYKRVMADLLYRRSSACFIVSDFEASERNLVLAARWGSKFALSDCRSQGIDWEKHPAKL